MDLFANLRTVFTAPSDLFFIKGKLQLPNGVAAKPHPSLPAEVWKTKAGTAMPLLVK